eukprot:3184935-Karenia_brevis.AAC.1
MEHERDRDKVCDAFAEYLSNPLNANVANIGEKYKVKHVPLYQEKLTRELVFATMNKLENALQSGASLRLGCHCHPK